MVYQHLLRETKRLRGEGKDDAAIRRALSNKGWRAHDVSIALKALAPKEARAAEQPAKPAQQKINVAVRSAPAERQAAGKQELRAEEAMVELWKAVLLQPGETLRKERYRARLSIAAQNVVAASMIIVVYALLLALVGKSVFQQSLAGVEATAYAAGNGIVFIVAIILAIFAVVLFFNIGVIHSVVVFALARLSGGKGSFWRQSHLMALVSAACSTLLVAASVVGVIASLFSPQLGLPVAGVLSIAIAAYATWLIAVAVGVEHGLQTRRAFLTVAVPSVIIAALLLASFTRP